MTSVWMSKMSARSQLLRARWSRALACADDITTRVASPTSSRSAVSLLVSNPPSLLASSRAGGVRFFRDDSRGRADRDTRHMEGIELEEGSQHSGVVRSIQEYGVFVRIDGMNTDGLVHITEMADSYVKDPAALVSEGDRVQVLVLAHKEGKISLSMVQAKPTLPEDFQPCTVAVFGLPFEMADDEVRDRCMAFGTVCDVTLIPSHQSEEKPDIRSVVFVTFETRDQALLCIKSLKLVTLTIGMKDYKYRVAVKMGKRQTYKEELLQRLHAEHEEKEEHRQNMQDPESRRAHRMAQRALRDIIPYAFH